MNKEANAMGSVRVAIVGVGNCASSLVQGVEYYNTLRRLGKPVIMLEYTGENHGLARRPNQRDYTVRMKEYFDHYLMGAPAPDWIVKGLTKPQT